MNKFIGKIIFLSALLWFGNVLADSDDSPLADLHKGTLVLPCVYVLLDDGSTALEPIAFDVRMNRRGSSSNWEVVDAVRVADTETECPPYQFPNETDDGLDNPDEEDDDCVPANANANNCHDPDEGEEDDSEEDDEDNNSDDVPASS